MGKPAEQLFITEDLHPGREMELQPLLELRSPFPVFAEASFEMRNKWEE